MAVDVVLLLAFLVNAPAQRRSVVVGHPQLINAPEGRNPMTLRGSDGLIRQRGKARPGMENPAPYVVPYPVLVGYGSMNATAGDLGSDYGPAMAPLSGRGLYVDARGPYVEDAGPYVDSPETSVPEPASIGNTQRNLAEFPLRPSAQDSSSESSARGSGPEARLNPENRSQNAAGEGKALFWIALKDHRVYTAVAYWVQGQTLHYVTAEGSHNQVSLPLVDRQMSARLNDGPVSFVLAP